MASYQPMFQGNENEIRAPAKMQQKVSRKPLGDVTNSTKLHPKGKPSTKNVGGGFKAPEKVSRKPLGDLTNSNKPLPKEKAYKKSCSGVHIHSGTAAETFCHNHQKCIEAQRQSMSVDYFLETVALQKEATASVSTPQLPGKSIASKLKLETPMKYAGERIEFDMWDICGGTPAPKSPVWNMNSKDLEFSGFKPKEEFSGFKLTKTP